MLVDVSDFLPPGYKLPAKEAVKEEGLRKAKASEDSKSKDTAPKLMLGSGVGRDSSSKQGKNALLKPKPLAEDQIFIVVRRGKVLPGSRKSGRAKKREPQVASRVKAGRSSTSKISTVNSTISSGSSKISNMTSTISKISDVTQVASPVKIGKSGTTSKISTVSVTSNISTSKILTNTSKISSMTSNISSGNSKITTTTHLPPTTVLPNWKVKEAEKDVEARRREAKRKKKVEKY